MSGKVLRYLGLTLALGTLIAVLTVPSDSAAYNYLIIPIPITITIAIIGLVKEMKGK